MNKLLLTLAAMVGSVALVACGGGDDEEPVAVVTTDTILAVNGSVAPALANEPFVFSAVPDLGTTSTTTLSVTSTETTPTFAVNSAGMQATGRMTFGSCVFTVTQSTFPAGHRLALGQVITVNPCNVRVNTAGQTNNGVAASRSVALILGAAVSAGEAVSVGVNPGGQLVINGNTVGIVTLTPVTG